MNKKVDYECVIGDIIFLVSKAFTNTETNEVDIAPIVFCLEVAKHRTIEVLNKYTAKQRGRTRN
jgi:hypothetical protein